MRNNNILFFLIVSILFIGCKSGGNKFSIHGQIANMPAQTIFLSEVGIDKITVIDSTQSDGTGKFNLSAAAQEPGLYRINFSTDKYKYVFLSIDKGEIEINADWNAIQQYTVKGSPSSESLAKLLGVVRSSMQDFNTLGVVLDTFKARGNDSMVEVVTSDIRERNYQLTQFIERYADTIPYLPNVVFAAQILNPQNEKEYFKALSQHINKAFPNTKLGKDFVAKVNAMLGNAMQPMPAQEVNVGVAAPEIALPSFDGKEIKLSSFKGKYVLVDFWASWCGPCRKENPNVVAAYNKFKNKNFDILGVSLDDDKEKWTDAVNKDQLTWNHVSDLKGWESIAARTYNVQAIPTNFLIDPNGVVIARDLRGSDLEEKLAEVLK